MNNFNWLDGWQHRMVTNYLSNNFVFLRCRPTKFSMRGDYALLYTTTDRFLVHGWFLMLLLTLLSLRSGKTNWKTKSVDM